MSSCDRRAVLLGLTVLAGCGFAPAYGPGSPALALRNRVEPEEPGTRLEFAFVEQLEARLGRAVGGPLLLRYDIDTTEDGLAITNDQEIQRYNLVGRLSYDISKRGAQTALARGRLQGFTSYSAIGTTVATRASQRDAEERLAVLLADRLVTELIAGVGGWRA